MSGERNSRDGVLRTALWTLRQPRYAALAIAMVLVAFACIGAGTWQVFRYEQNLRQNHELIGNAHAEPVALSTSFVPLAGQAAAPDRFDIRFRPVTLTGRYLDRPPQFVRNQQVDGNNGFYVLSPVRTSDAILLVVRGFVRDVGNATPGHVPAAPAGTVHLTARLQTPDTSDDHASALPHRELESINPVQQARRAGAPVYNAYALAEPGQPGTAGLTALPSPDLSNPAGGAYSWQHFAYIIQWYVFALLAFVAPFIVARAEIREARRRYLGVDAGEQEFGLEPADDPAPELEPGERSTGELVLRGSGAIVRPGESAQQRFDRAARLADRYGRSFGPGVAGPHDIARRRRGAVRPREAQRAYRAADDTYRARYNDYLWELALADAQEHDGADDPGTGATPPHVVPDGIEPTTIRDTGTRGERPG